jgi:hypothetical protein
MKAKIKPLNKRNAGRPKLTQAQKIAKQKAIEAEAKFLDKTSNEVIAAAKKRRKEAREAHSRSGGLDGQRLVAPTREGFKRRYVNDDNKGNIDKKLRLGYYFIQESQIGDEYIPTSDQGTAKSQRVGVREDGSALIAYLMEIPEEFYQETQDEKEERIVSSETQVRQGRPDGSSVEEVYDPSPHSNNFNI